MKVVLENNYIKVIFDTKGAEVKEMILKKEKKAISHDPNTDSWKRVAPVLFPIVSRLPEGKYTHGGEEYQIPGHGFARDMEFSLISCTPTKAVFSLVSNKETLKMYPFKFKLLISYSILRNRLTVQYDVFNTDDTVDMYYMIGGHPGIKCDFKNATLKFEKNETAFRVLVDNSFLITDKKTLYLDGKSNIQLTKDLFRSDALILTPIQSSKIKLSEKGRSIEFGIKNFPIFSIWSPLNVEDKFICLEPWAGIRLNMTSELSQMGTIKLEPQASHNYSYYINVLEWN